MWISVNQYKLGTNCNTSIPPLKCHKRFTYNFIVAKLLSAADGLRAEELKFVSHSFSIILHTLVFTWTTSVLKT